MSRHLHSRKINDKRAKKNYQGSNVVKVEYSALSISNTYASPASDAWRLFRTFYVALNILPVSIQMDLQRGSVEADKKKSVTKTQKLRMTRSCREREKLAGRRKTDDAILRRQENLYFTGMVKQSVFQSVSLPRCKHLLRFVFTTIPVMSILSSMKLFSP